MSAVAVGIDVGLLARKGLDLVALDHSRRIVHSARRIRNLDDLLGIVENLSPAVVCIDSPSQWVEEGVRRPAELELARRGINLYATPSATRASPFHSWMRDGFSVYAALVYRYPRYTGGPVQGTAAEYFPHAAAVALAEYVGPLADKVAFRRQLLAEHGVDVFSLTGPDQVDAALGALTGLIGLEGKHTWVGEGTDAMLLPVRDLPARFPRVEAPLDTAPVAPRREPATRSTTGDGEPCRCGCGGVPAGKRSRFLPGHDNRMNPATGRRWNEGAH